jgi:Tol biopolymer transport system component
MKPKRFVMKLLFVFTVLSIFISVVDSLLIRYNLLPFSNTSELQGYWLGFLCRELTPFSSTIEFIDVGGFSQYEISYRPRVYVPLLHPVKSMGQVAWSPNGRLVAFTLGSQIQIYSFGDEVFPVTIDLAGEISNIAWSPNSEALVFSIRLRDSMETSESFLYTYNLSTGITNLLSNRHGAQSPSWSPTNEWISYTNDQSIYLIRPDGTEDNAVLLDIGYRVTTSWSPDGTELAFNSSDSVDRNSLRIFNLITQEIREIYFTDTINTVSWSPDGEWIAFSASPTDIGPTNIFRIHVESQDLELLTMLRGRCTPYYPSWSPDFSSED